MKHLLTILALVLTVGVATAQDKKPEGQPPAKKEGKGDKKGPVRPEGVDEATWKKFPDAMKAAQSDDAVKAAKAKAAEAKSDEEKKEAGKAGRRKEEEEGVILPSASYEPRRPRGSFLAQICPESGPGWEPRKISWLAKGPLRAVSAVIRNVTDV